MFYLWVGGGEGGGAFCIWVNMVYVILSFHPLEPEICFRSLIHSGQRTRYVSIVMNVN